MSRGHVSLRRAEGSTTANIFVRWRLHVLRPANDEMHDAPSHPTQAGHPDAKEADNGRFSDVCQPREAEKGEYCCRTSDQKDIGNDVNDSTHDVA
jgi:hypothetical protein